QKSYCRNLFPARRERKRFPAYKKNRCSYEIDAARLPNELGDHIARQPWVQLHKLWSMRRQAQFNMRGSPINSQQAGDLFSGGDRRTSVVWTKRSWIQVPKLNKIRSNTELFRRYANRDPIECLH